MIIQILASLPPKNGLQAMTCLGIVGPFMNWMGHGRKTEPSAPRALNQAVLIPLCVVMRLN